ncbi:MAG: nucleoid-associated protein [Aphanocapsa lilacina HA4352-LM1]|jgi:hypothetical protein|nr:nucleoid-associated protein [Aphanocapsa lilacina HA4352-LM1]
MRYPGEVRVQQLVIHVVDPHRDNVVFSERDVPLDGADRLVEYFGHHIRNSLQDPVAGAGRFEADNSCPTFALCRAMLHEGLDLIGGSGKLAGQLAEIIRRNRSISPGVLVAGFYTDSGRPEVPRFLALLKMDPSQVFRHVVEREAATGRRYVRLALESDVLPSEREKLQKCAFVQPLEPRHAEYDMLLLDRQTRVPTEVPVAKFFVEGLLGAKLALDARGRTDRLFKGLMGAYNDLKSILPPGQGEQLRQAVDAAVRQSTIDLEDWLESLPLAEEHRRSIDRHLAGQHLNERTFDIDRTYGRSLLKKRVFRGDHSLRVEVSADPDKAQQVIQSTERIEIPGTLPYYRVVLHTERWDEIAQ